MAFNSRGLDSLFDRRPSSRWELFLSSPVRFISEHAYKLCLSLKCKNTEHSSSQSETQPIRVVCISDTHNAHKDISPLPEGDILIHAGDLTQSGSQAEANLALSWLDDQPHPIKFVIAGNHDTCFAHEAFSAQIATWYPTLHYLHNSSKKVNVRGRTLNVYGSPWTPVFGNWVFQYPRGTADQWSHIPPDTDILITHGPPTHHLGLWAGCSTLLNAIWRICPRLHVFGHIHATYGTENLTWSHAQRAYEAIDGGSGGWWQLGVIVVGCVEGWWRNCGRTASTLVNAAVMKGLRDEERNPPVVVMI